MAQNNRREYDQELHGVYAVCKLAYQGGKESKLYSNGLRSGLAVASPEQLARLFEFRRSVT